MSLTPRIDRLEQNVIINGNFDFWQRQTSFTNAAAGQFTADRFKVLSQSPATMDVARSTDVPATDFPSQYSLQVAGTATGSPTAGDIDTLQYIVEGYDLVPLFNRNCVLSFWVKSSLIGTYSIGLRNDGTDISMALEYEIEVANTWERKEIQIDFTAPGTWNFLNGRGVIIDFVLSGDRAAPSVGTWQVGDFVGSSNQVNFFGSLNTLNMSQVKLCIGDTVSGFSRAGRNIAEEFAFCQRYYTKTYLLDSGFPGDAISAGAISQAGERSASNGNAVGGVRFPQAMRAVPTVNVYSTSGAINTVRYNGLDVAVTTGGASSESGFIIQNNSGGNFPAASGSTVLFQYEASAEL